MPDLVPTVLSGVCTLGIGMTLAYIKDIKQTMEKLNGHVFRHESELSHLKEQLISVDNKVTIAHERIDAIKGDG